MKGVKDTQRTLGDYEIIETLGEGLIGTSYLARHQYLNRRVLLQLLPEEIGEEEELIQRFTHLATLLSSIDHPHIAKIQSASSDGKRYFLVLDHIPGLTLKDYLDVRAPLTPDQVFTIGRQLASALDYSHSKELEGQPLKHLGINASTIYLCEEEGQMRAMLTELGYTSLVHQIALVTHTYQRLWEQMVQRAGHIGMLSESILQSYAFLAPEQKGLVDHPVDARADTYAFGVLLNYLLTGHYPEGAFDLPAEWEGILRPCLQHDPEKRPLELLPLFGLVRTQSPKPQLKPQKIARPEYDPDPGAIFQTDTTIGKYTPKDSEVKELEPLLTEMIVVEGGGFLRGSLNGARDEMPRHAIQLSSFAIDIHPVTNEQFVRFLEAMGGEKDFNNNDIIRLRDSRIKRHGGRLTIESGYSKHPVVGVTYYGALAYASWVGKRLPTEAEWEIAALGGSEGAQYPTGSSIERTQANFFSSDTTAVMSYPPNEYGLFDMAGNVYEWCQDWYGYNYYETSIQEPDNPKGPPQGVYRVLRGGCWKSLKEDLRCAHRHRNNPGIMNGTYGFRCVADVL